METLWQDLRYSLRALVRKPAFTLATVITLALGIGANTAIFSVINALLLRSLPYPDAGRLVMVTLNDRGGPIGNTSYADYTDWKERSRSFDQLSAIRSWGGTLTGQGEPEMIEGMRVSASYFRTLGISPALGRDFTAAEDRPDTRFVVILSHSLWQRRFNADPAVIGKPVVLTGNTFTVVGVMPRGFEDFLAANFYQRAEVWAPLGYSPADPWACRGCQHLKAVGRVRSDVSLDQARAEMNAISEALVREHPQSYPMPGITITRLQDDFVGALRPALFVLLGAVGFVLLIACANVANLLLVRGAARSSEMAVRTALGAGRGRIVRQLVTESVLLAAMGAVIGTALAAWVVDAVVAFGPRGLPRLQDVSIDGRVLAFSAGIAVLTGLIFGLVPALHAARPDIAGMLRESVRGSTRGGANRTR
ncbi:MAG TPA: ABC transporter permease, partial [Blastocatellia bacterium]|nr:ABC transporter permease [Blastocatellia bacterium]